MSDPTRFDLDDRQRAMLAEMGVRVWWPQHTEEAPAQEPGHSANAGANLSADAGANAAAQSPATGGVNLSANAGANLPANAGPNGASQGPMFSRPGRPGVQSGGGVSLPSTSSTSSTFSTFSTFSASSASSGAAKTTDASGAAAQPSLAPLPAGIADMGWDALQEAVNGCQACALCSARKAPILGSGLALPTEAETAVRWMVVGDAPSQEDDQQGQPYTGPEGQLLDNMLKAVGVRRHMPGGAGAVLLNAPAANAAAANAPAANAKAAVVGAAQAVAYLTHAVKCRPPGRNPEPAELATCAAYLSRQVALVQPHVILVMGRFAIQSLLGSTEPMGKLRGRVHEFQGVPVVVTFPPDALLRNSAAKAKAWEDLVLALGIVKPR